MEQSMGLIIRIKSIDNYLETDSVSNRMKKSAEN